MIRLSTAASAANAPRLSNRLRASTALLTAVLAALSALPAQAQTPQALPAVPVETDTAPAATAPEKGLSRPLGTGTLDAAEIASRRIASADAAALLRSLPGVSLYSAGGFSSLPALNGLADDRVRVQVDGMPMTAACANHMNAPLSYADPSVIDAIEAIAGVTPVSKGGDSIAGTISVTSKPPVYAQPGEPIHGEGSLSTVYRSNGNGTTLSGTATAATERFSLRYTGAWSRADDYKDGDGDKVRSTLYNVQNHALSASARKDGHEITLSGGYQYSPYSGFANQRMDMTLNRGTTLNGHYKGAFDWGTLDGRAFWQRTVHAMNFLHDKGGADRGGMPMNTDSHEMGYAVSAEVPLSSQDTLRVGNELVRYRIDDWWPPVTGAAMMSPLTFVNLNDARRDRLGTFAEWEKRWAPAWTSLLGVRNDVVWMDNGPVQPYSWANPIRTGMMGMGMGMANPDAPAATAFNRGDRSKTDVNVDATALLRFAPSASERYELGFARKTRSPNLYERFAWGTGGMSSTMIGWYGDANGYVGNPDLKPETAYTVGATAAWQDAAAKRWSVKVTPYYSHVENFIDADRIGTLSNGFVQLRFANHTAELYGINAEGRTLVHQDERMGEFTVGTVISYVRGRNLDTGRDLYHIMPLNGTFDLGHRLGDWSSVLEFQMVGRKFLVDSGRNEPETPSYALVNLRTSYVWGNLRADVGIENLLDAHYYLPLGGVDYGDFRASGNRQPIGALAGMGRSFNLGLTMAF
ncbi:iron complex outermembrane receptor protein [Azospirillum brasilense]|nr:iron complex outermembrane receptor protein [Azospirillum brasilense]